MIIGKVRSLKYTKQDLVSNNGDRRANMYKEGIYGDDDMDTIQVCLDY